jgi:Protein of unknown function (DUF1574)
MKLLLRNIVILLLPLFVCELLFYNPFIVFSLFEQLPNVEWSDGMPEKNVWKETILMGSSLVREGINPQVLQEGLIENGIKTTVGSIAVPSDRLMNDYFTFNRIMATCKVCPRKIILGVQDLALKQVDIATMDMGNYNLTYVRIKQNYLFDKNSRIGLGQAAKIDAVYDSYDKQLHNENLLRLYYFREYSLNYLRLVIGSLFGRNSKGQAIMTTQVAGDPGYGFWPYTERLNETVRKNSINNYRSYLGNYKIGGGETIFLAQFLRLAKQKHINIYIVLTPVTDYYTKAFSKEIVMFRSYIKGVGQKYNIPVIDETDYMPKEYKNYTDTNHLNKDGADVFSQHLAGVLSKLMR